MTGAHNIPWKTISDDLGEVPFYVVEFDKDGNCTSPQARDELVKVSKTHSDVFLFSHGWNNDWMAATDRYDRFVEKFAAVRQAQWKPSSRPFTPVLAGVFWPSTALVMPGESAPDIAAAAAEDPDVAAIAAELDDAGQARLREILTDAKPDGPEQLAELLAPVLADSDDAPAPADRLT